MLEIFLKNLVRFITEMPLSANLFRLGFSIQKHVVSNGAVPVGLYHTKKNEKKNVVKIKKKKYPS